MRYTMYRNSKKGNEMKVAVYKNLNTGKWSVTSVKKTRNGFRKDKVIEHVDAITLDNASFYVGAESTRQRIVNGHREVYAYAIGDVFDMHEADPCNYTWNVHFNPHKSNDFVSLIDGEVEEILTDQKFDRIFFMDRKDPEDNEVYVI